MTTISTTGLPTSGYQASAATLSRAEAAAAVRSLSPGDKTALVKIARFYAQKTPYDHEDLLQEAICRVLGGARVWPRDVPAVPFLWGVVRSIAWEWKRELIEAVPVGADPACEERRAIAGLDVARIIALFDDDPVARMMVRAMMEGARGQELQELSGLDKTEYESKRTKIRRRIEKFAE
jgi:DNA-directed RNA polymerase specialized sigma24 family protein